jgi:hypothetical protein
MPARPVDLVAAARGDPGEPRLVGVGSGASSCGLTLGWVGQLALFGRALAAPDWGVDERHAGAGRAATTVRTSLPFTPAIKAPSSSCCCPFRRRLPEPSVPACAAQPVPHIAAKQIRQVPASW